MRKILLAVLFLGITNLLFADTDVIVLPGQNLISGKAVVTTANTPVVLGPDTAILSVTVTWATDSKDPNVYVGSSSLTGNNGATLTTGSVITLKVNNLNDVYINSLIANGRAAYIATIR